MATIPRDIDWVEHSFMLAEGTLESAAALRSFRYSSTADFKYTAAGFGMSTVLNPAPQFTPYADPRREGLWRPSDSLIVSKGAKPEYFQGQGVAYSEMIDDNKQIVHIRAGVTQFKGMATFFTGFYDNNSALLARQGRASLAYYFGLGAMTLATLPLQIFVLGPAKVINFLLGRTTSSYMSLKPAMPLYWERVNILMNSFGANLGVIPRLIQNTGAFSGAANAFGTAANNGGAAYVNEIAMLTDGSTSGTPYRTAVKTLLPGIMADDGTINILRAVSQATRRKLEWESRIENLGNFPNTKLGIMQMMQYLQSPLKDPPPNIDLYGYIKNYHTSVLGSLAARWKDGDGVGDTVEAAMRSGDGTQLTALGAAAKTGTDTQVDPGSAAGDVGTTDTATAAASGVPPLLARQSTTSSLVDGGVNANGVPNLLAKPTAEFDSATTGSSAGVDSDSLRQAVFGKRQSEFTTVIMGKDNAPTDSASATELSNAQQGLIQSDVEKNFFEIIVGWMGEAKETFDVGWENGYEFVSFAVTYTGAGSMSVSNSMKETTISGTLKGVSSTSRDSRISLSDYRTGFAFIDGAMNIARDVFSGALDAVSMSGLMALAGNAFIDFPKQWDDSTATVPTANFTIEARSVYGNVISSYLQLYPIISAICALGLPISTGTQSYTAPFALEAYCQGHFAIRYGMVSSINIRHGVGNLGYTGAGRRPLAFDIDVEIADFSSVYHMAITNGLSPLNMFKRVTDDDNLFSDYLCTISGMSLSDMTNVYRKLSIRMAAQWSNIKTFVTPDHVVSKLIYGSDTVQTVKKLFGPTTYSA